jgi:hypothetical protein
VYVEKTVCDILRKIATDLFYKKNEYVWKIKGSSKKAAVLEKGKI